MQKTQSNQLSLENKIKAEAFRLGFALCGFTTPEPPFEYRRYENWLSDDLHGGMTYLESDRHRSMRKHPPLLMSGVKTILCLAWPYALQELKQKDVLVAGYTSGLDYHHTLPERVEELKSYIQNEARVSIQSLTFTDSAPILERELALRAGLGWIGKNACLISKKVGSAFLLAELFIDYPLQPDIPHTQDHCGTCHRCLDACPTHCILENRTIDARRCISYLTIESKGTIPLELRTSIGSWLFGCDICQSVCPWNRKVPEMQGRTESKVWTKQEVIRLLYLSPSDFSLKYKVSAFSRSKLKGMQRNALIWLGNNGDIDSVIHLEPFFQTNNDPDLLEIAKWAIYNINKRDNP